MSDSRHPEYACSYATVINNRGFGKPNEDRLLCDEQNGFFAVLDGVTRTHSEYDGRGASLAADATEEAIASLAQSAKGLPRTNVAETESALRAALLRANERVLAFNSRFRWDYAPGAVGVVAALCAKTLCFAYFGDCCGMLLRGGARIVFTEQQTLHSSRFLSLDKPARNALACNNPSGGCGYALLNGDPRFCELLRVSHIALEPGDAVFLFSDGISGYMNFSDPAAWRSADAMLAASTAFDCPPYAEYADDKTLIRIDLS